jgi:imidazole glycerol phosphate synthase subunit HisF
LNKTQYTWGVCYPQSIPCPSKLLRELSLIDVRLDFFRSCLRCGLPETYETLEEESRRGLDERIVYNSEDLFAVPLISLGEAGNFDHLKGALRYESVSGVACGSLFYPGDNSPIKARSYLRKSGITMRKAR